MEGETGIPFRTTRWRLIEDLRSSDDSLASSAREALLAIYWPAVYGFLRRRGMDREQAEDVTQGFFVDVILRRRLLERARSGSGSFRAFLLASLKNYRIDLVRSAVRRDAALVDRAAIDRVERGLEGAGGESSPESVFERAWAESILSRAIHDCEAWHGARGRQDHWRVFETRVLGTVRSATSTPSYARIAEVHGFETEAQAREVVHRVKKRLVGTICELLVADGAESPEELLNDVLGVLSGGDR